mmetsp:Transcript_56396/g.131409  ORF Transcript_56396/g.131409 Transcript_56396/m.131409 type:complete len:182 (-) Transcript_56396:118-663(-)
MDMMKIVVPSGLFEPGACLAALAFRENPRSVELAEDARAPRVQSTRTCPGVPLSKLAARKGTKMAREPGLPWGRDYLRFALAEGGEGTDGCSSHDPGSFADGALDNTEESPALAVRVLEAEFHGQREAGGLETEPSLEEIDEPVVAMGGWGAQAEGEGQQACCSEGRSSPEGMLEGTWCSA